MGTSVAGAEKNLQMHSTCKEKNSCSCLEARHWKNETLVLDSGDCKEEIPFLIWKVDKLDHVNCENIWSWTLQHFYKNLLFDNIQWKLVGGKYFVEWEGTRCSATAIWEGSKNPISQRKGGGESSQLKKHLIFFWFIQLSTGYLYDL